MIKGVAADASTPFCKLSDGQRYRIARRTKFNTNSRGADPKNRMHFFCFALADFYDAEEDKARRNTVGNAVAESHKKTCKESGYGLAEVIPINLFERGGHHHADSNECGRCSSRRNCADKCCKESGKREAYCNNNGSKTCTSARTDTGCAFYKCRCIRCSEQCADRGGCGISKQRFVQLWT